MFARFVAVIVLSAVTGVAVAGEQGIELVGVNVQPVRATLTLNSVDAHAGALELGAGSHLVAEYAVSASDIALINDFPGQQVNAEHAERFSAAQFAHGMTFTTGFSGEIRAGYALVECNSMASSRRGAILAAAAERSMEIGSVGVSVHRVSTGHTGAELAMEVSF